jgi:hypothetical protein
VLEGRGDALIYKPMARMRGRGGNFFRFLLRPTRLAIRRRSCLSRGGAVKGDIKEPQMTRMTSDENKAGLFLSAAICVYLRL